LNIFEGSSKKSNAQEAILEAIKSWDADISPDILFVFHSTTQDVESITQSLTEFFPQSMMVGCTTAGEWITGQHTKDSLVLLGLETPDIRWAIQVLENLDDDPAESAKKVCSSLLKSLNIEWNDLNAKKHFCLSFFDGMSYREEPIIAAINDALGDIPLLGGSAGDDLKFQGAYVIANGQAYQHAAVFVLAESLIPFRVLKHQHFSLGEKDVVITKADTRRRLVYHLDGIPAAQRYAELLGLDVASLTAQIFSDHPVMYAYGNDCYVRAIRQVCDHDALEFGCAIEEGMLLNLCDIQDMKAEYNKFMNEIHQDIGKGELLILCNCIYRALEGSTGDINQSLAENTAMVAKHLIGFDTYGEQWQGLHINQTLVGLLLGKS